MIKKPNNWDSVHELSDRKRLPLGAYVCNVLKVTVESTQYGDVMQIGFDICEGEYKNFFRDDFNANTREDKKWRGVLRQWLPKDDGSEKDEFTKSAFKTMLAAFTASNNGFVFDWNEKSLVGKTVGVIFRNEEWEMNGKSGWSVRPFRAVSADKVRSGDITLPKDKPLKNKANATVVDTYSADDFAPIDDGDDLPF